MSKNEQIAEPKVYIVATPIGNKSDISQRALDVLKNVDVIACEDSRTSAKLLDFYGISTKVISYHKFNERQRTQELLDMIEQGLKIALISDAGTPCISDPGRILVDELIKNDVKITSIPGACAIITFLSLIPRSTEEFAFCGFLPRVKTQILQLLDKYKYIDTVFYESPNRLLDSLKIIKEKRGDNAKVAIGRELTKMFEEVKTGTVSEIIEYFENNTLKGEIVGLVYACELDSSSADKSEFDAELKEKINKLKSLNFSDKDISQILSSLYGLNKNKIYKLALSQKI